MLGKNGTFQDFDATQLPISLGLIKPYFHSKTSLLSEDKDVRYLWCISIKSLDFRDYEIAICMWLCFVVVFLYNKKNHEEASRVAELCVGPCDQMPHLGT